jgi:quercetin dioxygenase-like cupin family protein
MIDDEREGGDPPCWAHLLEDEPGTGEAMNGEAAGDRVPVVDLAALAREVEAQGVAWSLQSEDLNANLLVFGPEGGVEGHVNSDVDVLIVVVAGEGILEVDDTHRPLRAGQAVLIAKGSRRSIRGVSDPFAYLTCHRRRGGLWPSPLSRYRPDPWRVTPVSLASICRGGACVARVDPRARCDGTKGASS